MGYVTNWIALKWIFEPLNPVQVGPFVLQGMFLKRQLEVSYHICSTACSVHYIQFLLLYLHIADVYIRFQKTFATIYVPTS